MSPSKYGAALGSTMIALAACGGQPTDSSAGGSAAAPAPSGESSPIAARALRDVLGATLAELGVQARDAGLDGGQLARELRSDAEPVPRESITPLEGEPEPAAPADLDAGLDPELVEMREGLLGLVTSNYQKLDMARRDIAHVGDEMVPVLSAGLRDPSRTAMDLRLLAELAVTIPSEQIALDLAGLAATHEEPWLRAYAAWVLRAEASAPGAERVMPRLVRRLKYERDADCLVWLSATLAAFGNFAGLEPLLAIANRTDDAPAVENARRVLAELQFVRRLLAGIEAVTTGEELDVSSTLDAWRDGRTGREEPAGAGLRGELWTLVADLSGEHFQLRGVDDARYVLARLGPWAGREFAAALEDDDEYVRLHVAQVLERMGPRGRLAFDSLVAALHDPHGAVAGAAAEALAAVAGSDRADDARAALLARWEERPPYEQRVALVRAMGRLAPEAVPLDRLKAAFAEAPASDMKLAAAEGVLALEADRDLLGWLAAEMTAKVGDPAGAEALASRWLGAQGDSASEEGGSQEPGVTALRSLREAWAAAGPEANVVHNAAQATERRAARSAALAAYLLQ